MSSSEQEEDPAGFDALRFNRGYIRRLEAENDRLRHSLIYAETKMTFYDALKREVAFLRTARRAMSQKSIELERVQRELAGARSVIKMLKSEVLDCKKRADVCDSRSRLKAPVREKSLPPPNYCDDWDLL